MADIADMQENPLSTFIPPVPPEECATFEETADSVHEDILDLEISRMWEQHCSMQGSVKQTRKEMTLLGRNLGEALSRMKRLLAKPGRSGGWSAFLKERKIPRTTADRLVSAYERSLCPEPNRTDGAIPDSPEAAVRKLFASVWPKLKRVLTTREAVALFMAELTAAVEACFQEREATEQGQPLPVSASDGPQQPGVGEGLEEEPWVAIDSHAEGDGNLPEVSC